MKQADVQALLTPHRKITGISAILLPFNDDHTIDWEGFEGHLQRTLRAGLIPAVNMDTGYASLIDESTRLEVLQRTHTLMAGATFIAGVFVGDSPGEPFDADRYRHRIDQVQTNHGTPIFFQSFGLIELSDEDVVSTYETLAKSCEQFIFFELGKTFAPFGTIYSLEVYEQLMCMPNAIGAKHSSLHRLPEWQRLALRNRIRPEFKVFTGNDLAIDMVVYGSDYLLGLSTFAPDAFATRDAMWAAGDTRFYEMNDLLQRLGAFTFRSPAPAYKHSAAMFLKIRGMINHNMTHPDAPKRPHADIEILESMASELRHALEECS
ncbi:dihydrodipicolinate synthase family protein [Pirellulales bacterium]|nr:dihydrodipicolinate synthase family protein [Pirellulales bacterium]